MADLRNDPAFASAVAATHQAIRHLARVGIEDARALVRRSRGWNHLQGHARSVVPLAVLLARKNLNIVRAIRTATVLRQPMTSTSREARDRVWGRVGTAIRNLLRSQGGDVIAAELRSRRPQTARSIARTYLSRRYAGGQGRGGAGDTVLKRTLKILAHVLVA